MRPGARELTLIVAGCSLAVAVGGGLVDRKRPFTLLRVSGTQFGVLSKVVLLEAAVPLVAELDTLARTRRVHGRHGGILS